MNVTLADLQPFCVAEEVGRYHLSVPWQFDEFITATDGHAAIVVPASVVVDFTEQPSGRFPDIKSIIPDLTHRERVELSLAALTVEADEIALAETDAYLSASVECDDCDGEGICSCDCNGDHNCRTCDGDGRISIETPPAKQHLDLRFNINDKAFQYRLIKNIREFVRKQGFESVTYFDAAKSTEIAVFTAGEAAFYVMPMRV